MDGRTLDPRELLLGAVLLLGITRLVEPPLVWGVGILVLSAAAVASLQLLAQVDPAGETTGVPVESLIVPSVAVLAAAGVIRLVPIGLWLVPALAAAALIAQRVLATEADLLAGIQAGGPEARRTVMGGLLVVAFLGFLGVAASVPGGLPDAAGGLVPAEGIRLRNLAVLTAGDAGIAGLLAYRAAALRRTDLREVFWSALTCAAAVGIASAGLRAMAIPRLMGPALLVIVFYLWDSIHAAVRADQRDARRIWETILLAASAVVVIVWSLKAPG